MSEVHIKAIDYDRDALTICESFELRSIWHTLELHMEDLIRLAAKSPQQQEQLIEALVNAAAVKLRRELRIILRFGK